MSVVSQGSYRTGMVASRVPHQCLLLVRAHMTGMVTSPVPHQCLLLVRAHIGQEWSLVECPTNVCC